MNHDLVVCTSARGYLSPASYPLVIDQRPDRDRDCDSQPEPNATAHRGSSAFAGTCTPSSPARETNI